MTYQRCVHLGNLTAYAKRGSARLPLHECLSDERPEKYAHEALPADQREVITAAGTTVQPVACCKTCPLKVLGEPKKKRENLTVTKPGPAKETEPAGGPGTELFLIFQELKIKPPPRCKCRWIRKWMDRLGPQGCRDNKDQIVVAIHRNEARWKLKDKIANVTRAAVMSILTGLVLKIDPTDPIPGFVDLAILRAERSVLQRNAQNPIIDGT